MQRSLDRTVDALHALADQPPAPEDTRQPSNPPEDPEGRSDSTK
jgi:hypothetical protein